MRNHKNSSITRVFRGHPPEYLVIWSVHPAKKNMTKTVLSLIFILVFVICTAFFYGIFWGILGFLFLLFSLHSYYFPTTYGITDNEVIIKNIFTTQKRRLSEFKKVYQGRNGVLLSPFNRKTFLNHFRGIFLFLPAQNEEIIAHLRRHIGTNINHQPV